MEERRAERTEVPEKEHPVKKALVREHAVGKSVKRVDAFEKVTGRAKYTDDLCGRDAYVAKVMHSTIAHGYVKSIDTSEAEKIPGVVKIVTCFDVPAPAGKACQVLRGRYCGSGGGE